jgi:WD40 repeat protein
LWDWKSGELIRTLEGHSSWVTSVAFSPNGLYALSGSDDNTMKLWDWQRGEVIQTLEGHNDGVNSVAFSPDGKYALSGSDDNTLKLWDWKKGIVKAWFNLESLAFCCAFSPDGQFIAAGDKAGRVYFFKLEV